jgi:signal transduction histidine kinase
LTADLTKIRQNLFNLLSNACKFTKDGEITIKVETFEKENQKFIKFMVSDSGIGMSQEQANKIFQPFTQADESTTRKFGGTGLGLTITKVFCEMMGGSIDVTSVAGKGTTFMIEIPRIVNEMKLEDQLKN